jgi:hypothetical protein
MDAIDHKANWDVYKCAVGIMMALTHGLGDQWFYILIIAENDLKISAYPYEIQLILDRIDGKQVLFIRP